MGGFSGPPPPVLPRQGSVAARAVNRFGVKPTLAAGMSCSSSPLLLRGRRSGESISVDVLPLMVQQLIDRKARRARMVVSLCVRLTDRSKAPINPARGQSFRSCV